MSNPYTIQRPTNNNNSNRNDKTPVAYLNIRMENKAGNLSNISSMPFYAEDESLIKLLTFLNKSENNFQKFIDALRFDIKSATPAEDKYDL